MYFNKPYNHKIYEMTTSKIWNVLTLGLEHGLDEEVVKRIRKQFPNETDASFDDIKQYLSSDEETKKIFKRKQTTRGVAVLLWVFFVCYGLSLFFLRFM